MAPRKQREWYDGAAALLPEVLMVGSDAPRTARQPGLAPHVHRDAYELCYIVRGSVEWWAGEHVHEVGPGQVYVTRPGEPHGGVDAMLHPCELYWVQVRFGPRGTLPGLGRRATTVAQRYAAMCLRCFPGSASLKACYERLLAEHRRRDAMSVTAARAALHELLVTVLRDHDAQAHHQRAAAAGRSPAIERALAWMDAHLDEDFGVEALAAQARLSVTHFHERFRAEVGFTPADWRTRQRIARAKRLLRRPGGGTVTEVALACGFSSSQYFATVFKRIVGLTPMGYRRRASGAGA